MTGNDGALGRLLAQLGAGTDCLVEGAPAASRALFAQAAAALAERAEVITVVSPLGELGLSALIAQVSGRPDFDEQDDAVLALGFKRLTAPDRPTVLMLAAPQGIALPTLRYLQHVGRSAPGLVLVILASPALDATLEQPGADAIRTRLRAGAVIVAESEPAPLPSPPLASLASPPFVVVSRPVQLSSPTRRRAWLLPWAAAMVSVAAASVIVVQLTRASDANRPISIPVSGPISGPISVPVAVAPVAVAPVAVAPVSAAPVVAAQPVQAVEMQTSTVIAPAPAAVETPTIPPPVVPPPVVPPIVFPSPPSAAPLPPVKPDRVLHARRVDPKPRVARAGRPTADWRADDYMRYQWEGGPYWQHRAQRWDEGPTAGGYVVDQYGRPLYPFSR